MISSGLIIIFSCYYLQSQSQSPRWGFHKGLSGSALSLLQVVISRTPVVLTAMKTNPPNMSQPLVNETLAVYSNAKDENKLHKADSESSGRSAFSANSTPFVAKKDTSQTKNRKTRYRNQKTPHLFTGWVILQPQNRWRNVKVKYFFKLAGDGFLYIFF